jgi:hypothetical protein
MCACAENEGGVEDQLSRIGWIKLRVGIATTLISVTRTHPPPPSLLSMHATTASGNHAACSRVQQCLQL